MEKPELLIFDMDGLMTDTERLQARCLRTVGAQYGYEFPPSFFTKINGMDNRRIGDVFKEEYGPDFPYDKIYKEKRDMAAAYIEEHGVPEKTGLRVCLDFAKEKGIPCAVASSTPLHRVKHYLEKMDVLRYFAFVQSGEEIERGKPFPDIFLHVCTQMNVNPSRAIVLEDSANGLRAAAAAGIPSIWIPDMVDIPMDVKNTIWKQGTTLADVPVMLKEFY